MAREIKMHKITVQELLRTANFEISKTKARRLLTTNCEKRAVQYKRYKFYMGSTVQKQKRAEHVYYLTDDQLDKIKQLISG